MQTRSPNHLKISANYSKKKGYSTILGNHPRMLEVLDIVSKVADSPATVLIRGESGTGKELVASAIHFESSRKDKPFITINCGAIPDHLLESELFGHSRGAFTGAYQDHLGWFEKADGGTIFLDEICEMPIQLQVKILRVLQSGEYSPIGCSKVRRSDVRVLAAANKDLQQLIQEGKFRKDLYFRLNVIDIELPPLREREGDILLLANYFLEIYSADLGKKDLKLSSEVCNCLMKYDFPGNVRELQNIIKRAVIFANGSVIESCHLPPSVFKKNCCGKADKLLSPFKIAKQRAVENFERQYIADCLKCSKGNITCAARIAGINVKNFHAKMSSYEIDPHDFK